VSDQTAAAAMRALKQRLLMRQTPHARGRTRMQPVWRHYRDALGPITEGEILAGLLHTREQLEHPSSWQGGLDDEGRATGATDASGRRLTDEEYSEMYKRAVLEGLARKGVNANETQHGDLSPDRSGHRSRARRRQLSQLTAERVEAVQQAVAERLADEIRRGRNDVEIVRLEGELEQMPFFTPDELLLVFWNNAPQRTHAHVRELLDAAIARQRARVVAQARRLVVAARRRRPA
jgi:hypothetical protein